MSKILPLSTENLVIGPLQQILMEQTNSRQTSLEQIALWEESNNNYTREKSTTLAIGEAAFMIDYRNFFDYNEENNKAALQPPHVALAAAGRCVVEEIKAAEKLNKEHQGWLYGGNINLQSPTVLQSIQDSCFKAFKYATDRARFSEAVNEYETSVREEQKVK